MNDLLVQLDELRAVVDLTDVFDEVPPELACCTEIARATE
jgi:hypothetical protein